MGGLLRYLRTDGEALIAPPQPPLADLSALIVQVSDSP